MQCRVLFYRGTNLLKTWALTAFWRQSMLHACGVFSTETSDLFSDCTIIYYLPGIYRCPYFRPDWVGFELQCSAHFHAELCIVLYKHNWHLCLSHISKFCNMSCVTKGQHCKNSLHRRSCILISTYFDIFCMFTCNICFQRMKSILSSKYIRKNASWG